jgi:hypothetical protein
MALGAVITLPLPINLLVAAPDICYVSKLMTYIEKGMEGR